jgi:hypothetical protein
VAKGWFHAGFSLARGGEAVGLFAPDGSLVDGFTFGPQTNNVSLGRYPDGPGNDVMPIEGPTPEAFNAVPGGNLPPRFQPISTQFATEEKTWSLRVLAMDPDAGQTVRMNWDPMHRSAWNSTRPRARCHGHPPRPKALRSSPSPFGD